MSSEKSASSPFREEAVAYHFREADSRDILRASPLWTWLVLSGSATLLLAATMFVTLVKLDMPAHVGGTIAVGHDAWQVIAYARDIDELRVHTGDVVRVALHGYPPAEFGYIEGRVKRVSEPLPAHSNRNPQTKPARIQIAIRPPNTGPLAVVSLHAGMAVNVRFTTRKRRLISFLLGPLTHWWR